MSRSLKNYLSHIREDLLVYDVVESKIPSLLMSLERMEKEM